MESSESKSLALLRILQILEKYTDCNHPMTQMQIADKLDREFGITVERKSISRKLSLLKEALEKDGICIESVKNGTYLDTRKVEDSELRMLIDGVLCSRYINETHSEQLIHKLCALSNVYFKSHIKNVYSVSDWGKTDNYEVFLNIDCIDEAIERNKQISFEYHRYGNDKKLHRSKSHTVSPYQLILHNQRYYLMALDEVRGHMVYYKLDRIKNVTVLDAPLTDIHTVEGYKNGIDYKDISSSRPYMFADKAELVTMICDDSMIDHLVDWFGYDFKVEKAGEKLRITVRSSLSAMEYWALQYLNSVEIVSPPELRERLAKDIAGAVNKYKD